MNYKAIYDSIIDRAKTRKLNEYKENHHIIPKCLGGTNDKNNLVQLTAREHFICHMLLCELYPDNYKLQYALWAMANQNSPKQDRRYVVSSRLYERLKREISVKQSERMKGRILPREVYERAAKTRTGKKRSAYQSKKINFQHTCDSCNKDYKSADVKGKYCPECKKPRACECGCGTIVKTPGRTFARGCKTRGKTYADIYHNPNPSNGFKKGNKFGKQ